MILYVYAIADGLADAGGLVGSGGDALRIVSTETLDVVVAELPGRPPVDRAALEAQDRIVRALHERATALLPARFGTAFQSLDDLARAIATGRDRLRAQLEQVRGKEQMTLRILGLSAIAPSGATADAAGAIDQSRAGRNYLERRAAKNVVPEVVPLLKALEHLQRGTRVEPGAAAGLVATVYHLIDRGSSEEYRRVVESAAHGLGELSVRISGPSPCYAFA